MRVWESERKDLLALLRPPEHRARSRIVGGVCCRAARPASTCMWGICRPTLCFVLCRRLLSLYTCASRNSSCFSVARFAVCASGRASGKTSSPCFVLLSTGAESYCRRGLVNPARGGLRKIGMSGILANDFASRESQHRSKLSVLQGRIVREATRHPRSRTHRTYPSRSGDPRGT